MIDIKELFDKKPLPKWFKTHSIFKNIDTVKKIFPSIGLPNCQKDIIIDNKELAIKAANELIIEMNNCLADRIASLYFYANKRKIKKERIEKVNNCAKLLIEVKNSIAQFDKCISITNNKLSIKLPNDIVIDGKRIFRESQSLFRVFNSLNTELVSGKFVKMRRLEDIPAFKDFSMENVPSISYKIFFSSDEVSGAWDIATMSMRGISSCQSWDGEYKHCTIGSVIDPFVGIVYLTSDKKFNTYGSKMIRRCIVRFVINETTGKPYLLLDRMYPSTDKKVVNQFIDFLKSKVSKEFEVHYHEYIDPNTLKKSYLPLKGIREKFETCENSTNHIDNDFSSIKSYQDTFIPSKKSNKKDRQAVLFDKNTKSKEAKFINTFEKEFQKAIANVNIELFPNDLKPIIQKLKGIDKSAFNNHYIISELARTIANSVIYNLHKNNYPNSNKYVKRIYCSYFSSRLKLIDAIKANLLKTLNTSLALKNNKLKDASFMLLIEPIIIETDKLLKEKFRELLTKEKIKKTNSTIGLAPNS